MKLSTKGKYGVRALFEIARNYGKGPLAIKEIAERQQISLSYLEQILHRLGKAGIIESVRGPHGGYELARKPAALTIGDVVRALEGPIALSHCLEPGVGGCYQADDCVLLAGETITFTWENAPTGADKYEFVLVPLNKEPSFVLGVDFDDSDGVAVSWSIPEHMAAELPARAYFPDDQKIELSFAPMIYSGDSPPAGVCSLIARNQPVEVYRLPDRTAEVFALLYPSVYAHVLEIAPNGWYRIDASVAEVYTPPLGTLQETSFRDITVSVAMSSDLSAASGEGWVNNDKGVLLKQHYEEAGKGTPLIFVHEFSGDLRSWEPQLPFFARRYRCIAFNARGYPPSDVPRARSKYGWRIAVDDIADVLRQLRIRKAHVAGCSMGAYSALQFGMRYPAMALSVTALAAGAGSDPDKREAFLRATEAHARLFETAGTAAALKRRGIAAARIPQMLKDPRGFAEFRRIHQTRRESEAAIGNDDELAEAREYLFFHLTGHAGLLRAGVPGRVRVGVGWQRPVLLGLGGQVAPPQEAVPVAPTVPARPSARGAPVRQTRTISVEEQAFADLAKSFEEEF